MLWNVINPPSLLILGLAVAQIGPAPVLVVMAALTVVAVTAIALIHRPAVRLDLDAKGDLTTERSRPTLATDPPISG
jgi:hypothetical protein